MSIPEVEVRHTRRTRYPERRGVSRRTVIEEAKAKVATIDLADRLCGPAKMRRVGKEWAALCPLPDHEERTPSFTVDPAKDVWFCHGCLRGGDVITLAQRAWDIDRADVAAAELLHTFGHEIPQRPPAWFRKQERQAPVRAAVEQTRRNIYRRRLFKYCVLPALAHIEDDLEHARELRRAWADFKELLS
jgi:DNA primase